MPTGTCRFPDHHGGPSAGPPAGFVAALIAGALIVAEWHAVVLVLAVCGVLAAAGACIALLVHSHRSQPYDAAWTGPESAEALPVAAAAPGATLRARVEQLELQLAERRQLEQPAQHLHLHGLGAAELAEITARLSQPAQLAIDHREDQ